LIDYYSRISLFSDFVDPHPISFFATDKLGFIKSYSTSGASSLIIRNLIS